MFERTVFGDLAQSLAMRRIGFLLNPIAGMGGRVGLKGTDGKVEEARKLGATPQAPERARRAFKALEATDVAAEIYTWGEPMGASVASDFSLPVTVLGSPSNAETSAEDTMLAVTEMVSAAVDVILFVGGDGTAVDIVRTLTDCDASIPILGVPAGVKIYSSTFAITPEDAGRIVATFEETERREVSDIDEDAYRAGEVRATPRGVALVPVAEEVQSAKQLLGGSVDAAVDGFVASMDPTRVYFLGPGGTIGSIKEALNFDGTPLGVDVWQDGEVLVTDAAEADLLAFSEEHPIIVVSPIGGQGFIFGRGNQQFSPTVIRSADIEIVASRAKLNEIGVLRVDTGDPALDADLRGWVKVRIGRVEQRMMEIV